MVELMVGIDVGLWGSWIDEDDGEGIARKLGREDRGAIGNGSVGDVGRGPEGELMCIQG